MKLRAAAIAVVVILLAGGVYLLVREEPQPAPSREQMADDIGADVMLHLHRGHVPGRSGEIMLVPKPHGYLTGRYDLRSLGGDKNGWETFVSHPNPWAYLARVPLIFYRDDAVQAGTQIDQSVNLTDVASTYARILGLDNFSADGQPLEEVVRANGALPRVIVTVVLDGGGWNVLRRWPDAWPNIAALMADGTTYTNATIGSAPSLTGAIHANLGTGFYPTTHGVPTNPWFSISDPSTLKMPTVSEIWDERNSNRAVIAMLGYEDPHVTMIGRGAQRTSGDHDIAVLWNRDLDGWESNNAFYELPNYIDSSALAYYERKLDAADGAVDGRWQGEEFERIRESSPAFATLAGEAVVEMIQREPFGQDDVTDLLWVELKSPDNAGHAFNMESVRSREVLRETDRQVGRLRTALDERVGAGNFLFVLTADHGQEPFAEVTGGWRINLKELEADIEAELGPVIEEVTTLDLQVDVEAAREQDVALTEIADFVATYTLGDNIPAGAPGADNVPEERHDDLLFAGAFPSDFLTGLTRDRIESFGASTYSEGDLTSP